MPLLLLPAEILVLIFDHIGPLFFQQNVGHLAVSKYWFGFALPACLRNLTLGRRTLRHLITSGVVEKPTLRNSFQTLDIKLVGYSYCSPTVYEAPGNQSFTARINTLNNDLAQLAVVARQSHKLRTLRITAWSSWDPDNTNIREDGLSLRVMQTLLSLDNLSVLNLDLSNELFDSDSPKHQEGRR